MAYIKALSELGERCKVVFFSPDPKKSRVKDSYSYIEFNYFWDKGYINIPIVKKICVRRYMKRFCRVLKPTDNVLVYGFPDLVIELSRNSTAKVYSEKTEHPEISFICGAKKYSINDYLDACRKISGVIVISEGLKRYFVENDCEPKRVHVVNMIVDPDRFNGIRKQKKESYIAYCGTAGNNKDGVDQLIKAFALVVKKHPEFKLYIIGKKPSPKLPFSNLDLVKELGIVNNVVFTGVVPASEIPQMLMDATVLALDRPDNMQAKYGFPTKLGEYLLTANPVVITNVGDIPLFLKDGVSALIAEPDKPQVFADKLCWAIEHPEEAKIIGERGKLVAENCFDCIKETCKLLEITKQG